MFILVYIGLNTCVLGAVIVTAWSKRGLRRGSLTKDVCFFL